MAKPKASKNKANDVESVKMELNIKERLQLTNGLLPSQGDIITLTIARDIREKTQFSQAEIKKEKLETKDSRFTWDEKGQKKKITFSSAEIELLKTQIIMLEKKKEIKADMLLLCLKIRK